MKSEVGLVMPLKALFMKRCVCVCEQACMCSDALEYVWRSEDVGTSVISFYHVDRSWGI